MDERAFKRIHFFKGFIRATKDYNDAVGYHLRKRRLHNRFFHGVGVVRGYKSELRVTAKRRPKMAVDVHSGYAIDPGGRDVVVRELEPRRLTKEDFRLPQTVYLVLRYKEKKTDHRVVEIPGFPRSEGPARVSESYRIEWTIAEPDIRKEIELCRIRLNKDTHAIRNAADPRKPRAGEIDLRHVPLAGVCGTINGLLNLEELRRRLLDAVRTFTHMARTRNIPSAHSAAVAASNLAVLCQGEVLDRKGFMACVEVLGRAQADVVKEAELNEPSFAKRPRFRQFAVKVENATTNVHNQLVGKNKSIDTEDWPEVIIESTLLQTEAIDTLHRFVNPVNWGDMTGELEEGEGIKVLDGTGWDRIKEDSGMPHDRLLVDNREWKLVDTLDLLDADSEMEHHFKIEEAHDWFRSQVTLLYPDRVSVRDEGIGHEGGYAEWEVLNLTPGVPVVIVRRMDYARGDYVCRVWCNDLVVGQYPCKDQDTRYRWRNWPFFIEGRYVRHSVIRLKQSVLTSNRDVNYFQLWAYQPV